MQKEREHLQTLIQRFQSTAIQFEKLVSFTAIQAVVVPGNEKVKTLSVKMQQAGFDVRPVLYPTVPKGKERLRIVLHAFNTTTQLDALLNLLQ